MIEELLTKKFGSGALYTWRKIKRNRNIKVGFIFLGIFLIISLFPWAFSVYDPYKGDLKESFSPPSFEHPFGTDYLGRDLLSRVLWGARTSLIIAMLGVLLASTLGTLIGTISGYYKGKLDYIIMRVVDVMLAFPDFLLALFIIAVTGPGLWNVILAIAFYNFPQFVRISRGSTLAIREMDYVEAAKALGEKDFSIIFKYILPNSLSPVIVHFTLRLGASILTAAGLSFLGLGVQPPTPDWGLMLNEALTYLSFAPYMWVFPGIFLIMTVIGLNLTGDGLNDVLNPRVRE
jgi:ABC-type dipeptide/oligopeptide/nickel transport system permease subunit